ncbi:hypothetical protein ACEZDB_25450 [Streptacidiphilus sp. N1-3]|uniref:Uncharacterized protein n=1 Tax=Streptacidiphilus alkalitolerans TaxID=3342712 RepID=A0ABV6X7Q0_9ACTN
MSKAIKEDDGYQATVSHEGIRAVYQGRGIPRWETVKSIVMMLADAATPRRDPEVEAVRFMELWRAAAGRESGDARLVWPMVGRAGYDLHGDAQPGRSGEAGAWTPSDVARLMVNPSYAIEIDPALTIPRELLVSEESWIKANIKVADELGIDGYLRQLLDVLKGDYVKEGGTSPFWHRVFIDDETAVVDEKLIHVHLSSAIICRLSSEPNILARAVAARHASTAADPDALRELYELEKDTAVMREAMMASVETWDSLSLAGQRLVFHYLIDAVHIGNPAQSTDEQILIIWSIPLPDAGEG